MLSVGAAFSPVLAVEAVFCALGAVDAAKLENGLID
jgi:hypothetical protein